MFSKKKIFARLFGFVMNMITRKDLCELFAICDTNKNGFLFPKELYIALSGVLGFSPIDHSSDETTTTLGEFIALVHNHYSNPETREERSQDVIRRSFLSLDSLCELSRV
jgi:hypothetical protein